MKGSGVADLEHGAGAAIRRRSPRRDAARNRSRLLMAGRDLFAEYGLAVTLHDVAARAGVGVGTAYRHFRSKDELVDEVLSAHVGELTALLEDALNDPDAWQGMSRFLDAVLRMQVADRGLRDALARDQFGSDHAGSCRKRVLPLLEALVERAKSQGVVRSDLEIADLMFIEAAMAGVVDHHAWQLDGQPHNRYLAIYLDGVRRRTGP